MLSKDNNRASCDGVERNTLALCNPVSTLIPCVCCNLSEIVNFQIFRSSALDVNQVAPF